MKQRSDRQIYMNPGTHVCVQALADVHVKCKADACKGDVLHAGMHVLQSHSRDAKKSLKHLHTQDPRKDSNRVMSKGLQNDIQMDVCPKYRGREASCRLQTNVDMSVSKASNRTKSVNMRNSADATKCA